MSATTPLFPRTADHEPFVNKANVNDGDLESSSIPLQNGGQPPNGDSFSLDPEFQLVVGQLVPTTDDSSMPSLTFRVWILGAFFCCTMAFTNQLIDFFRTNPIAINSFVTVLLSYPLGRLMAAWLPRCKVRLPFGYEMNLNPGPFSVKEHVLINVFGSTGSATVSAFVNLGAQEVFYDLKLGMGWDLIFILCTSTMGFGLAGLLRQFVIRPPNMVWPTVLPTIALFTAFHPATRSPNTILYDANVPRSPIKVFAAAALGMSIWSTVGPGWMSKMLTNLPLLCWIAPKNNLFWQRLGSPRWGPGILSLALDWTYIGSSAMTVPFWSSLCNFVSWVLFAWILVPIAWKADAFGQGPWTRAKPMLNSMQLVDAKGNRLMVGRKVTPDSARLQGGVNIHMSPMLAAAYFGHVAGFVSGIVHTVLWFGPVIWRRWKNATVDQEDIHCKLIARYPDVPDWLYLCFFFGTGVLITIAGQLSGVDLPWWVALLAMALAIFGAIPTMIIFATAGVNIGLTVVSQLTIGLILPGRPILLLWFKCVCFSVAWQCRDLLVDLKIGHYMKTSPRDIFICQLAAQLLACLSCYAAFRWWLSDPQHKSWILNLGQIQGVGADWGSVPINTAYTASLIWGAIGPRRFFFDSPQYSAIIWAGLLSGLILPIALYLSHHYVHRIGHSTSWFMLAHPAILLSPNGPGPSNSGYFSAFLVSVASQFFAYRYRREWWTKYNYVLAVALDVGAATVSLVVGAAALGNPSRWILGCGGGSDGQGCDVQVVGEMRDWCHVGELAW